MRIAIVYSLPSKRMQASSYSETDADSAVIAAKVKLGLEARGMTTRTYAISEDTIEEIAGIEADCIFNLVEWCGADIELSKQVFKYLQKLEIPFTGSSEELFVLSGDKTRVKTVLQQLGAPTPRGIVFKTGDEAIPDDLPYPMIVKPSLEHCSMGLTKEVIATDKQSLQMIAKKQVAAFNQPALAEEFIVGRELLVYLLEERGHVRVLPIEEVVFSSGDPLAFQTYQAKWEVNHIDYQTSIVEVAKLSEDERKTVERVCSDVFNKMGFGGYARFDVRLKNGIPYILETNANPSVYDGDGSLSSAEEEVITGIKFGDYLARIIEAAVGVKAKKS